jgi:hypothetical protein
MNVRHLFELKDRVAIVTGGSIGKLSVSSPDGYFPRTQWWHLPTLQELQRVGQVEVHQFPSREVQLLSALLSY